MLGAHQYMCTGKFKWSFVLLNCKMLYAKFIKKVLTTWFYNKVVFVFLSEWIFFRCLIVCVYLQLPHQRSMINNDGHFLSLISLCFITHRYLTKADHKPQTTLSRFKSFNKVVNQHRLLSCI